jgi:hypothetical protein
MFKVTNEWLYNNRTANGGYTKDQLRSIGVEWPPLRGWKWRTIGKHITPQNKEKFESYRSPTQDSYIPLDQTQ